MVSITLSVPEELRHEMEKYPEINWSAVAREAIKQKVILLHKFKAFSADSELTENDALELGRKLNKSLVKRYAGK